MPERTLRRRLTKGGVCEPQRLIRAARGLRVWESARLGRFSLEAVAHELGWSTVSAMHRSVVTLFDLTPRQLGLLPPEALLAALVGVLRRPGGRNREKVAENE